MLKLWFPMISSFDKLKVAIATTALILAIMDPRRPFVVETNASAIAIGAILILKMDHQFLLK